MPSLPYPPPTRAHQLSKIPRFRTVGAPRLGRAVSASLGATLGVGAAGLMVALLLPIAKDAGRGWNSPLTLGLFATAAVAAAKLVVA